MTTELGKPNYSNEKATEFEKVTYFKLGTKRPEDRTLVLRIGPPYGEMREKGHWSKYLSQHFGYNITFVKKDGKSVSVPQTFLCPRRKDQSGVIVVDCPECVEREKREAQIKEKELQLRNEKKTDAEIDQALKYQKQWLKDHNLDRKYYLAAKNLDGRWGILTIGHKCKTRLEERIRELVPKGLDPVGVEKAVWFKFTRTGTGFGNTDDTVDVVTDMQADGSMRFKIDTLTDADRDQISKLPHLNAIGRAVTVENIARIVASGGDEDTLRAILNVPRPQRNSANQVAQAVESSPDAVETSSAPTTTTPAVADDEEAQMEAALAALRAKKAAKTATTEVPTSVKEKLAMSPEDFMKMFDNKR